MDNKLKIKSNIFNLLIKLNAFWSYNISDVSEQNIKDELLIEKSLIHLDINDLNKLFMLFPYKKIREVWKNQLCIQDPYYHELNIMLAYLYFNIKKPDRYLKTLCNRNLKIIKQRSDEWFNSANGKNF
jgi:hypothetical protein